MSELFDLVFTRDNNPFSKVTMARVAVQNKEFARPFIFNNIISLGSTLIPIALISYLVLKK